MKTMDNENVGLARAILDMELKMKHEIRQNQTVQLAKVDKFCHMMDKCCHMLVQMDNRMSILETKLEALLTIQQTAIHQHHHHSTGAVGKHAPKFSRTMNALPRNHQLLQPQGAERTTDSNNNTRAKKTSTTMTVPPASYGQPPPMVNQPYKAFGNATPVGKNSQLKTTASEAKQPNARPKQLLGTSKGRSEAKSGWTSRAAGGAYTDESGGDSDDDKDSQSDSTYSVAKPQSMDDSLEKTTYEKLSKSSFITAEMSKIEDDPPKTAEGKGNIIVTEIQGTSSSKEFVMTEVIAKTANSMLSTSKSEASTTTAKAVPSTATALATAAATETTGGFGRSRKQ